MKVQRDYRPDIDGLRAIAILTVLFFHSEYSWASGGFVGVDVFFVISGFLITRNILYDIQLQRFSLSRFYMRRARRLFPALYVTLALSLLAGYLLFSPPDLERLGSVLLYSVVSVSNFFFWGEAGYFNTASEVKPLLHTWSLGIEEQFYLLWPALLLVLTRFRKTSVLLGVLAVSGIVSAVLGERMLDGHAEAVFFLLPFRVFEFALGAICVWLVTFQPRRRAVLELLALAGLALILWPTAAYSGSTPFPGFAALLPCAGSALLIYAGQAPLTGLLLRNRAAVGIGLISYSVYLVHWPLIVFYRYWKFTPLDEPERIALIAVSLAGGALMWRFVEQPFRRPRGAVGSSDPIQFWAPALALALAFLAANTWGYKGWPSRYPEEFYLSLEEIKEERERYWEESGARPDAILRGSKKNGKKITLLGNSHAKDLYYALRQNGSEAEFTYLGTSYRCYNFGASGKKADVKYCRDQLEQNLLHSSWKTADAIYLHDHWPAADLGELKELLLRLRELTPAPIYVFGPKMTYKKPVPDIARAHMRLSSLNDFARQFERRGFRTTLNRSLEQMIRDELSGREIFYVDLLTAQCGEHISHCEIVSSRDSKFLYFDEGHFTARGAAEFGARLKALRPELF